MTTGRITAWRDICLRIDVEALLREFPDEFERYCQEHADRSPDEQARGFARETARMWIDDVKPPRVSDDVVFWSRGSYEMVVE